jgi:hypothetical protein
MFLSRPIHPYYFHADLIWWDGPFKNVLFKVGGSWWTTSTEYSVTSDQKDHVPES